MSNKKPRLVKSDKILPFPNKIERYVMTPTERVVDGERVYKVIGPGVTFEGPLERCQEFAVSRNVELAMWNPGPV